MSNLKNNLFGSIVVILLLCASVSTFGQTLSSDNNTPKRNSPYSRLGIGDPALQNYTASLGMGGLGASFADAYHVNLVNPASIGFLKATSFEIGGFARAANLVAGETELDTYAGNFSYISIGFPMKNPINIELDRKKPLVDWRMNFALTPYSDVGYTIESVDEIPGQGFFSSSFTGKGGTYKLSWTNAFEYKKLSVGLDIGYFFGNIIEERTAFFENLSNGFSTSLVEETSLSGFIFKLGGIYRHEFANVDEKPTKRLTVGAYASNKANINTNSSQFFRRLSNTFTSADPNSLDTIRNITDERGEIELPGEVGVGFTYEKINKFRVGIDFSASQFSNYTEDGQSIGLANSSRIAVGGEFIPNYNSYNKFLARVRYKAGLHFTQDARVDEFNEQLTETGVTIGMTMPVILPRGQKSWFSFALTGGSFGTDGSLNETFIRANIGFTLNDNLWFYKRKFN